VSFNIQCDSTATAVLDAATVVVNDTDKCNPTLSFTSAVGCPDASLDTISIFIEKYPWVIAIFLLIVGPVICFFGRRFIPWVIAVIGGLSAFVIALCLCAAFGMLNYIDPTYKEGDSSVVWVVIAFFLSLAAAVVVGWLLKKFIVVGLLIIAFMGGFFAGGLLYNLVFIGFAPSTWLLAIITFGCGIGAAVLAFFYRIRIIVIATALIGSYFSIRGLSLFIGGYPNEITLY
jgi:hypothetical protein